LKRFSSIQRLLAISIRCLKNAVLGKHEEAIRVNDQIIACPNTPPNFVEAAKRNRQFSLDTLAGGQPLSAPL